MWLYLEAESWMTLRSATALIPQGWCPESAHCRRPAGAEEACGDRQLSAGWKGCCTPKWPWPAHDLGLLASWIWENRILVFNSSFLWCFVMAVCAEWYSRHSYVFHCPSSEQIQYWDLFLNFLLSPGFNKCNWISRFYSIGVLTRFENNLTLIYTWSLPAPSSLPVRPGACFYL